MSDNINLFYNVEELVSTPNHHNHSPSMPPPAYKPKWIPVGFHQELMPPVQVEPTSSLMQPGPRPISWPPVLAQKPVPCQPPSEEYTGVMVPNQAFTQQEQDEEENSDLETDETLEMYCSTFSQLLNLLGPNAAKILGYAKNKRDKLRECKAENKVQLRKLEEEIVFLTKNIESLRETSPEKYTLIESLRKIVEQREISIKEEKDKVYRLEWIKKKLEEDLELKEKKVAHAEEWYGKEKEQCEKLNEEKSKLEETNKQLEESSKKFEIAFKNVEAERDTLKLKVEELQTSILEKDGTIHTISSELKKEWNDKNVNMVDLRKKAREIKDLKKKVNVLEKEKKEMLTLEQVMNNSPNQLKEIIEVRKRKRLKPNSSFSSEEDTSSEQLTETVEENENHMSGGNNGGGGEVEENGTESTTTPVKRQHSMTISCTGKIWKLVKRKSNEPGFENRFKEMYTECVNETPEVSSLSNPSSSPSPSKRGPGRPRKQK